MTEAPDQPLSTTRDPLKVPLSRVRRGSVLRGIFFVVVLAIVVLALFGFFGVRSRTVGATAADGSDVRLEYAQIARRGLSVPWKLEVDSSQPFNDQVTVKISRDALDPLSIRDVQPQPSSSNVDGNDVVWQFDQPSGSTFTLTIDSEIDSSAHMGKAPGSVEVLVGQQSLAQLTYSTWVWP